MATVQETITWASDESLLREYMGISSPDEANRLERLLDLATVAADQYMANPFEDDDGNNTLVDRTLGAVREGVYAYCDAYYRSTGTTGPAPGVTSQRTGDLSVGYAASSVTMIPPGKRALNAARPAWQPYQCQVWR